MPCRKRIEPAPTIVVSALVIFVAAACGGSVRHAVMRQAATAHVTEQAGGTALHGSGSRSNNAHAPLASIANATASTAAPLNSAGTSATASTATSTAAQPTATPPSCNVVPSSLVSSTLGLSVSGPVTTAKGSNTLCTFNPTGSTAGRQEETSVEFQAGVSQDVFGQEQAQAAKNNQVTSVTGIGSAAFSFTLSVGSSTYTILYVDNGGIQAGISAPASLSAEESLARQVIPAL